MSYKPGCQPQSWPVTNLKVLVIFLFVEEIIEAQKKQEEGACFAFKQKYERSKTNELCT